MIESPISALTSFLVHKRDLLKARVIINMSGCFLPSLWSLNNHSLLGSREPALL